MKRFKALLALALAVATVGTMVPVRTVEAATSYEELMDNSNHESRQYCSAVKGTVIKGAEYEYSGGRPLTEMVGWTAGLWSEIKRVEIHEGYTTRYYYEPVGEPIASVVLDESMIETYEYGDYISRTLRYSYSLPDYQQADSKAYKLIVDNKNAIQIGVYDVLYFTYDDLSYGFSSVYDAAEGYVYAYTYDDSVNWNSNTYPVFYGADKTYPVTEMADCWCEESFSGDPVFVYKLKVTNPYEFAIDPNNMYKESYQFVKINNVRHKYGDENGFAYAYTSAKVPEDVMYARCVEGYGEEYRNAKGETFAQFWNRTHSGVKPSQPTMALRPTEDGNFYLMDSNGNVVNYTGLYEDATYGWWLLDQGRVAFEYSDLWNDANLGWWKVTGGAVDFNYTGLYNSPVHGWWLINGGSVAFKYNDLWNDKNQGWWKINNGTVDFDYTGLYDSPTCGWWLIGGGSVAFDYTDLWGDQQYGWWKVIGGTVDFGYTELYESPAYGWWLVNGGMVNFSYSGMFDSPSYGAWDINGGEVVFH